MCPLPTARFDTLMTTLDPDQNLAAARDRLYTAFEGLAFDPDMIRSPGSVSDADVAALGGPVGALDASLVARFVLKAGTTWGSPADVRRIAPRALDLAADHQLPLDRGLLWAKLTWAGWPRWPTYQALTVREFLRAEWARLLRSDPRPAHLAHRWLREVCVAVDDLSPFLDEWAVALDPDSPAPHHRAATGHLVVFMLNSPLRPDLPDTLGSIFPRRPDAARQVADWLSSAGTEEALRQAAIRLADTTDSRRVGLAAERLDRFRTAHELARA